jgi:hypothetical protein
LISLRKTHLSDTSARYREILVSQHGWEFDSGLLRVWANFSDADVAFEATGTMILSSRTVLPHRRATLAPWEAVVALRGS